jgi:hypothetical protein
MTSCGNPSSTALDKNGTTSLLLTANSTSSNTLNKTSITRVFDHSKIRKFVKKNHLITAAQVSDQLESLADEGQARHLMRFFTTAPGEYGHGDQFLGIKVPVTRTVAKRAESLPLAEVEQLMQSPWHEVRLCGLLVLVAQFEAKCTRRLLNDTEAIQRRDEILQFYLRHAHCANNWDLVDLSVYKILGRWLMVPSALSDEAKLQIIDKLADSDNLWCACRWFAPLSPSGRARPHSPCAMHSGTSTIRTT